ncbi:hypothetical protein IOB62_15485 [Escherichia coli]|nr:hypothetical protein [Escherichia coli]
MASVSISCPSCSATDGVVRVPGFEPRIFAISLKPVPFFHSSKTEAFSSAVNVRLIQKTSATPCFHITVALTN